MEIENVLFRLREATNEINRATDDPRMKITMERSWLLQDRLVFPNKVCKRCAQYSISEHVLTGIQLDARSKNSVRALGHIHLCGVLHVSWQTRDGVDGQYMICLLYRDFLILASAIRNDQTYTIQACIGLCELSVEEVDNGKGIFTSNRPRFLN
jgi:hypothetical protein